MARMNWNRVHREQLLAKPQLDLDVGRAIDWLEPRSKKAQAIVCHLPGRCFTCHVDFVVGSTLIKKNRKGRYVHSAGCPAKRSPKRRNKLTNRGNNF